MVLTRSLLDSRIDKQERKIATPLVRRRPISVISKIDGARKCSICMGIIKKELPSVDCSCGSCFHQSCGARVGTCPICGKEIHVPDAVLKQNPEQNADPIRTMPLSKEDRLFLLEDRLLLGEMDQETYQRLKTEILTTMPEPVYCARCGGKLYPGEKCECLEDKTIKCAECGAELSTGDKFCRTCGLVVSEDFFEELFQCSACGRIVSSSERICTCGAMLLDPGDSICPDCGRPVSPLAKSCPNCGRIRIIELLECPSCGREVGPNDFECECGVIFEDMIERIECPECGEEVSLQDVFCKRCGTQFLKDGFSSVHRSI